MNELQILIQVGFLRIDQNYIDFLKGESRLRMKPSVGSSQVIPTIFKGNYSMKQ